MKLTDKEINAILSKSQDVRYSYSLKRIADNGLRQIKSAIPLLLTLEYSRLTVILFTG